MFGPVGGPELILILALALLLFGPRKMPQIGRMLGKALAEFRSVTTEFKSTLDREVALEELKKTREDLQSAVGEVKGAVKTVARNALEGETAATPSKADPGAEKVAQATSEKEAEAPEPDIPDGGTADKN
jgi:Tat protein translocase TatB subunit